MQTNKVHRQPITAAIGVRLDGLDLRNALEPDEVALIRQALLEHGVVFIPNQHLSDQELDAFVRNFGEPADYEYSSADSAPDAVRRPFGVVTGNLAPTRRATAIWHSDIAWIAKPPFATVIRAVNVPSCGGDTCWASMRAAYDALSEPFRQLLDGLSAVNSGVPTLEREPLLRGHNSKTFEVENVHPVIRVHPETGRKGIYVNECTTTRIVELTPAESAKVLDLLFAHIRLPDFAVRWHWSSGDLAFWDNRAVQHYAVPDYSGERVMQRVELAGDVPYGPGTQQLEARASIHRIGAAPY